MFNFNNKGSFKNKSVRLFWGTCTGLFLSTIAMPVQADNYERCIEGLSNLGISGEPARVTCEKNPHLRIIPDNCNRDGCYPSGSDCNRHGCWIPGGGCNRHGCYPPKGSSNRYGTSAVGSCNRYGCPLGVKSDLFNIRGRLSQ